MSKKLREVNSLNDLNVRKLFKYDHVTGILVWNFRADMAAAWNARFAGEEAGYIGDGGYRIIRIGRERYRAHRIAWLYMTGEWPEYEVDHANGDRADNRFFNLRSAKPGENNQNTAKQKRRTTSRFIGVSYRKSDGAWVASISQGRCSIFLGGFASEYAARDAYREAKKKLHRFQPLVRADAEGMS